MASTPNGLRKASSAITSYRAQSPGTEGVGFRTHQFRCDNTDGPGLSSVAAGGPLVSPGALSILNGAMRGAGDTFFAMVTGIVSFWLIRIPLATLFSRAWGRVGIWWAIAASITLAFIATLIYYRTGRWKRRL